MIREIGRGGTALVYLARERASGDEVAIKLIRAKYLENDEALARFAREARYVAQVDHPNVVPFAPYSTSAHPAWRSSCRTSPAERSSRSIRGRASDRRRARGANDARRREGARRGARARHRAPRREAGKHLPRFHGHALLADFGLARSMTADTQVTMPASPSARRRTWRRNRSTAESSTGAATSTASASSRGRCSRGKRPWDGESLYAMLYQQKYEHLPDVREIRGEKKRAGVVPYC